MDITTDGLGFMLVFGCLCWIPFVYSLQARYLVFQQLEMGALNVTLVLLVNGIGYYVFRTANGEKNDFRNGKNPKSVSRTLNKSNCRRLTLWFVTIHRSQVHENGPRVQVAHLRLVGTFKASELSVSHSFSPQSLLFNCSI